MLAVLKVVFQLYCNLLYALKNKGGALTATTLFYRGFVCAFIKFKPDCQWRWLAVEFAEIVSFVIILLENPLKFSAYC
ncbi:MAG: hypothetical protein RPR28_11445 [Cycloclasticus sp.]